MYRTWIVLLFIISITTTAQRTSRDRQESIVKHFIEELRQQEQESHDAFLRHVRTPLVPAQRHELPSKDQRTSLRKKATTGTEYGPDTAFVQTNGQPEIFVFTQRTDTAVTDHYYNMDDGQFGKREIHRQFIDPLRGIRSDEYTELQWTGTQWEDLWRWSSIQQSTEHSTTTRFASFNRSGTEWEETNRSTHLWYYRPISDTCAGLWFSCDSGGSSSLPSLWIYTAFGHVVTAEDGSSFLQGDSVHSAFGSLISFSYFDPDSPESIPEHAETQTTQRTLYHYFPPLHRYSIESLQLSDGNWVPHYNIVEDWFGDHGVYTLFQYSDDRTISAQRSTWSVDTLCGFQESYMDTLDGKEWVPFSHVRQQNIMGPGEEWYVPHEHGWRREGGNWVDEYRMDEGEAAADGHLTYRSQRWDGISWTDTDRSWFLPTVHGLFVSASTIDYHPSSPGSVMYHALRQPELSSSLSVTNYPNPFNPRTMLRLSFPVRGEADVRVYDLTGREAAVVLHGPVNAGTVEVPFDGSSLPSGPYFVRAVSNDHSTVRRMLLLK